MGCWSELKRGWVSGRAGIAVGEAIVGNGHLADRRVGVGRN
jgi:hypothetical protein